MKQGIKEGLVKAITFITAMVIMVSGCGSSSNSKSKSDPNMLLNIIN